MVHAKNYETVYTCWSNTEKTVASFFPDMVYLEIKTEQVYFQVVS